MHVSRSKGRKEGKKEVMKSPVLWQSPRIERKTQRYVWVLYYIEPTDVWRLIHNRQACRVVAVLKGGQRETKPFKYAYPAIKCQSAACWACERQWAHSSVVWRGK